MIERFIVNELTLKRWRRFKNIKAASYSTVILVSMIIISLFAPLVANNRPLYMYFKGESYFPAIVNYNVSEFDLEDILIVDYKKLEFSDRDWAIWPIVRWDPFESNNIVDSFPSAPTMDNVMGTDEAGRDVFARILYGLRYSMGYAVLVWILSLIIGIFLGGIMGYFGGKIDFCGQRIVEILSTVPYLFLILILVSIFSPSLSVLVFVTTLFAWIAPSIYIRAEFLKLRKREFVEGAKAIGLNDIKIMFRHILPNALTPIITFSPFYISGFIGGLASLDYLGFGLPVPTPSWGELLAQSQKHFTVAWWLAAYPSLALASTLILLNLIGAGVRDALDPNIV